MCRQCRDCARYWLSVFRLGFWLICPGSIRIWINLSGLRLEFRLTDQENIAYFKNSRDRDRCQRRTWSAYQYPAALETRRPWFLLATPSSQIIICLFFLISSLNTRFCSNICANRVKFKSFLRFFINKNATTKEVIFCISFWIRWVIKFDIKKVKWNII